MRGLRSLGAALCVAAVLGCCSASAREPGGLPSGRYTVRIVAPTLGPALSIDEQVFSICYTAQDARAHRNPVMPAAERATCKTDDLLIGSDLIFDDDCRDGQHRLRVVQIGEASYQGTYRFLARGKNGVMLEPAVQMRREGACP